MDVTGYGGSPKPMMDDPCNVGPKQQNEIKPRPLTAACAPNYAFQLTTIRSDWTEIDAVVDYLRRANGVAKIHIIGWSAGGPRVGGYAALHPEKVDRMVLYAPSSTIANDGPEKPSSGFPLRLQSREDLEKKSWDPYVRCPGQVEPGVRDATWKSIMQWDRIGASWGPEGGIMRGRTATGLWLDGGAGAQGDHTDAGDGGRVRSPRRAQDHLRADLIAGQSLPRNRLRLALHGLGEAAFRVAPRFA